MHWIAVVNGRFSRHGCLSWACVKNLWLLETFRKQLADGRGCSYHVVHILHRSMQTQPSYWHDRQTDGFSALYSNTSRCACPIVQVGGAYGN